MRRGSICARSVKKKYLVRQQNTTRDPDGHPFMTSSAKIKSYTDRMHLEVSDELKMYITNTIQNSRKTNLERLKSVPSSIRFGVKFKPNIANI